jgi:hypothetical protein
MKIKPADTPDPFKYSAEKKCQPITGLKAGRLHLQNTVAAWTSVKAKSSQLFLKAAKIW